MEEKDSSAFAVQTDRVPEITCPVCASVLDVSAIDPFTVIDCPACHQKQTVPAKLGSFRLINLISTGGMGAIYHGVDDSLGRDVAIKVMLTSLGSDGKLVETFKHEARMAASLNHPNVVQIYSVGQEKGQPYIVMELISGKSLEDMISETGPLPESLAIRICIEVAKGLSAGSEIGLVHGDIKPKNILVDAKGTAKVVDFGLATLVDRQASVHGGVWGTPYYIAPEKILKQPVDFRSDIYSLGATLYHALAGVPPFIGKTPAEVVKARLLGPPRALTSGNQDILQKTNGVVMRMLEDKPARRYPTYASLLGDLEDIYTETRKTSGAHGPAASRYAISRKDSAAGPVDTSEPMGTIAPQRRHHPAGPGTLDEAAGSRRAAEKRRNTAAPFVVLVVAAITILVSAGLVLNAANNRKKKSAQVAEICGEVLKKYDGIDKASSKYLTETHRARSQVTAIAGRYLEEKRPAAAALANQALTIVNTAIQRAGDMDHAVTSALQIRNNCQSGSRSLDVDTATKNLQTMKAREQEVELRKQEIRGLLQDAQKLLDQASKAN